MERTAVSDLRRLIATVIAAALVVTLATFTSAADRVDAVGDRQSVAAVPDGFQQYLTYMAQPRQVEEPTVVNYETFKAFQAEVWGRDEADLAAFRAEAIEFFNDRFGLDFSDAAIEPGRAACAADGTQSIPGATLRPSFLPPEREYRAYTIGGMRVPAEGYVVRDASFNVSLTPGVTLHGEYGGQGGKVAGTGGTLVFGDYNILVPGPGNSGNDRTIEIRFMSGGPIAPNADGVTVFVCDLVSEQWGEGQARGVVTPNGEIRNVLTFPAT